MVAMETESLQEVALLMCACRCALDLAVLNRSPILSTLLARECARLSFHTYRLLQPSQRRDASLSRRIARFIADLFHGKSRAKRHDCSLASPYLLTARNAG